MSSITFLGGLLLGLASSLHCAGMCGAIASSLTMAIARDGDGRSRAETLMIAQLGKTGSYVVAGTVLGAVGAGIYGLLDREGAYFVLQRAGAAGLVWVGLSFLGLVPPVSILDRVFAPLRRWAWTTRRVGRGVSAALAGLVWGLLPCGMVYAALLYAMLAGNAQGGALVMLGFGLGVMPSVTVTTLGLTWLPDLRKGVWSSRLIGGGLVAAGLATLVWPAGGMAAVCAPLIAAL